MNENIQITAWLKSNFEWYTPMNEPDLREYDYIELLSKNEFGDLFFCWYKNEPKHWGRLFRGQWNKGKYYNHKFLNQ
jgi:hypothetical protein